MSLDPRNSGFVRLPPERREWNGTQLSIEPKLIADYTHGTALEGFFARNEWPLQHSKPWELLTEAKRILEFNEPIVSSEALVEPSVTINGPVWIGKGTKIVGATYINGPCFIGSNCVIGPNSFLRPWSIIGDNCIVGFNCYVTNSIIGTHVGIFHFCGVSRSIIGANSMITSYVQTASTNQELSEIKVQVGDQLVGTGLNKFGCIVGPDTYVGGHALIMAGRIIGRNSLIGPFALVSKNVPDNSMLFRDESYAERRREVGAHPDFNVPDIPVYMGPQNSDEDE